jgi:hypothetical protein
VANTITAFASAIAAAQQSNFLQRSAEEGLDSNLAWRRVATRERIPAGIGQTMTMTRKSRVAPITTAATPQSTIPTDTASAQFTIEQYTLTMYDWQGAPGQIDAVQNQAGIFDQLLAVSRNSGVQAAQTKERVAQTALYNAYLSGNSRVRVDLGAGSTTTCHVDDIRGFQNVLVNGVVTAVGSGVDITVQEVAGTGAGAVTQTLTVTAVTADVTNKSTAPGGISGVLTFNAATTPVGGDQLLAQNNPTIIRPNGRLTTAQLTGGDFMSVQMLLDMKAQLENNAVPMFDDGFYELIADPTTIRQLFADQDFKVYFAGREQSDEVRKGFISDLFGIRITPTTEALIQGTTTNTGNGYTDAVNVKVARPMLIGAEALIEGTFQGLDNYLRDLQGNPGVVHAEQVDDTVQLCRYPTDMYGRWYTFAWDWIGGYAVPTDLTATSTIIPTANNALFKRAVVAEIAIG